MTDYSTDKDGNFTGGDLWAFLTSRSGEQSPPGPPPTLASVGEDERYAELLAATKRSALMGWVVANRIKEDN